MIFKMNLRLFSLCLMVSFLLKATSGQDGMGSTGGPSGSSGEPMGSSGGPEPEGSTGGPEGSTGGPEGSTGGPVPEASTGGPEPEASTGGPEPEASTGGPEGSTGESTDGGPIATTPLATPEATTSTASPGTKIHSSSSGATKPVTPPPVTHGTPPPVTQPTVKPTLPPAGEACTVPKVDPRSKMSNFGETLVVPNVTDCLPVCKSNTKFECQAYIWKGPGAGCILYGNIQHGATKLSNSPWTLVDLKCASSHLPESALTCDWNKKKDGLDPNSLTVPKKHRNALNANECRTFCEMKMLPGCGSYGFNSNSRVGDNNCFLLPSTLIEAEINLAQPGSYEIYKYECT